MPDDREFARQDVSGTDVVVLAGDITEQRVAVVVNAANEHLKHGGGVAAAISSAGGPQIQAESDRYVEKRGPLEPGEAATTTAGKMRASWVVHVVGPRYSGDRERDERLLRMAVNAALDASAQTGGRTVAMPAISTGVFGFPMEQATHVICATVADWVTSNRGRLDEVRLIGFNAEAARAFAAGLEAAYGREKGY